MSGAICGLCLRGTNNATTPTCDKAGCPGTGHLDSQIHRYGRQQAALVVGTHEQTPDDPPVQGVAAPKGRDEVIEALVALSFGGALNVTDQALLLDNRLADVSGRLTRKGRLLLYSPECDFAMAQARSIWRK